MASDRIPLLLIHGAWLSARSWETYADHFDERGYAVSAPERPRKRGDVETAIDGWLDGLLADSTATVPAPA